MVSACSDGHGGQSFYDTFAHEPDNRKIMDRFLATPSDRTIPDQWEAQILCRVLLQHPVILVTQAPREMVEAMHLHWAADLPAAIALADRLLGKADSPITVIPTGFRSSYASKGKSDVMLSNKGERFYEPVQQGHPRAD